MFTAVCSAGPVVNYSKIIVCPGAALRVRSVRPTRTDYRYATVGQPHFIKFHMEVENYHYWARIGILAIQECKPLTSCAQ